MAKKKDAAPENQATAEEKKPAQAAPAEEAKQNAAAEEKPAAPSADELLAAEKDKYLRLMAEYDNFRKRSQKEREALYNDVLCTTVLKILPVYDNLERALNQPTEDAAYKKGVEMTMNELVKILTGLGVEIFGAVGDTFDPALHNAVMHTEDESLGENVIAAVFQKGFRIGDKVVRFAMVQVAN